jgi:hypothetical protein
MLTFCVEFIDEDTYMCFAKEGNTFIEKPAKPIINTVGQWVKYLHLVCFFFGVAANWWVPKVLTSNSLAIRLVLNFVTVPVYIYTIFWFESGLEDLRYKFGKDSTVSNLEIKGTVCVS